MPRKTKFLTNKPENLREKYEEKPKREVKVEGRAIKNAGRAINIVRYAICGVFASIGIISLAHPALRYALVSSAIGFLGQIGLV